MSESIMPQPIRWAAIAIVSLVLLNQLFFTVDQTQQAIVLQFGKPVRVERDPGLKLKIPFVQNVTYYDKRVLSVDLPPARVTLASGSRRQLKAGEDKPLIDTGGEPVIIDTFARVRITNPILFLQRLRSEYEAEQRIQSLMNSAMRDILGRRSLRDILSPARVEIMDQIRTRLNAEMKDRGMEVVDVRIVRADLTERMESSTINRMITERRELATDIRSTGQQKATEMRAEADRERTILLAEANKQSQILRGEGDREAIAIYAAAQNKDPAFYGFLRSMEAYKAVLAKPEAQFVLSPQSGFLRYMETR